MSINRLTKLKLILLTNTPRLAAGYLLCCIITMTGCRHDNFETQGYIEGKFTYIASTIPGIVKNIFVTRGAQVTSGQTLLILEQQPESDLLTEAQQRVAQANAQQSQVQADVALSKLTLERNQALYQKGAIQKASLDTAQTNYKRDQARLKDVEANLAASKAALAQAQWSQAQKVILAPVNALVFDVYYRTGELVQAGHPALVLLAPENIKAIFFIPEQLLGKIKLGDSIRLDCDNCSQQYTANIRFISPNAEYTPPLVYNSDTTSKLVYRIEADLAADAAAQLHPGQPVSITCKVLDK